MKKYYYLYEDVQHGPVSLEELKEVNLTRDTLVWYEGIAEWTKAESLTDLNHLFVATPPPPPKKQESVPPPIPQQSKTKSEQVEQKKPKSNILLFVIGVFVLIGLIYLVQNIKSSAANQAVQAVEENKQINESLAQQEKESRQEIISQLNTVKEEVINHTSKLLGGFTDVVIKLDNPTKFKFKYVKVEISYFKENGGFYKTDELIYYNVDPFSSQELTAPETDRGSSFQTSITAYESPDIPKALQRKL